MTIRYICPDCHKHWATSEGGSSSGDLGQCCPSCHAARKAKVAEINARYPSAESLGLVGSITEIPTERYRRPNARGRRVVHKGEIMAG